MSQLPTRLHGGVTESKNCVGSWNCTPFKHPKTGGHPIFKFPLYSME